MHQNLIKQLHDATEELEIAVDSLLESFTLDPHENLTHAEVADFVDSVRATTKAIRQLDTMLLSITHRGDLH